MYFSESLWDCKRFKKRLEDANEITISEKNHNMYFVCMTASHADKKTGKSDTQMISVVWFT